MKYQVHVTDEWQTDTMVVQVRQVSETTQHTQAIGQVLEDRDGMPVMEFRPLNDDQHEGREHLIPTPGIRLRHDVAVAMARAILTDAGKDADEVERLKGTLDTVVADNAALSHEVAAQQARGDDLQNQVNLQERLIQTLEAAADREARVADHFNESLEHDRRDQRHEQARRHHPSGVVNTEGESPLGRFRRTGETGV